MPGAQADSMDALEIESLLDSQPTGVLALAKDDDAYAIPVSYMYHGEEEAIFFRMGFAPASQKQRYLEGSDHVAFVVYDDTPEGWKSVVVEGRLTKLSNDSLDSAIVEVAEGLDIPYYQVHERPATDVQFNIVRLDPVRMSGIVEGKTDRKQQHASGVAEDD